MEGTKAAPCRAAPRRERSVNERGANLRRGPFLLHPLFVRLFRLHINVQRIILQLVRYCAFCVRRNLLLARDYFVIGFITEYGCTVHSMRNPL